ncbi:IS200/IS605 family element transposase accessory protein TnpB [archaeon]|nr:IS200/IS605 family element transposase accessory protein TnpB [archaeon]
MINKKSKIKQFELPFDDKYLKLIESLKKNKHCDLDKFVNNINTNPICSPFWNNKCQKLSVDLPLPNKTNLIDVVFKPSNIHIRETNNQSWFTKTINCLHNKKGKNVFNKFSTFSVQNHIESTKSDTLKCRKIRFYPNAKQKNILKKWFGTARFVYNKVVNECQKNESNDCNFYRLRKETLDSLPLWAKDIPNEVKAEAVNDYCKAVKNAIKKYKRNNIVSKIGFRSKKDYQSIFIPKRSVKNNGFYPRLLCTKKICENRSINPSESFTEAKHSCRVTFDKYGRYHICIPIEISFKRIDNQERLGVVALDPGVRTFQSYYNKYICGEWGKNDWKKIMRLCFIIDKLCSEIVKAKSRRRKRLRKARLRIQLKVKNLVNELHNKLINFLCLNFDVILIPEFKTKYMVKKLFSKIARSMLTLSHYTFKEKLKNKAKEHGCIVIEVNESYTSKTCGNCGYVNKKSKSKTFDCSNCKVKIDRDLNGARNIMIRALRDASF